MVSAPLVGSHLLATTLDVRRHLHRSCILVVARIGMEGDYHPPRVIDHKHSAVVVPSEFGCKQIRRRVEKNIDLAR